MEGQPALLHDTDVVERQGHFFQIAKITEFGAAGDGSYQQVVRFIVVKYGGEDAEIIQGLTLYAEQNDGVGFALFQRLVVRQFEQVGQREPKIIKHFVKVNIDEHFSDAGRVA